MVTIVHNVSTEPHFKRLAFRKQQSVQVILNGFIFCQEKQVYQFYVLVSQTCRKPLRITLLPSTLSSSASFTISLFQMINYSVVYLHCDLSICLRIHSDCERVKLQWAHKALHWNEWGRQKEWATEHNLNAMTLGAMLKNLESDGLL